MIKLVISDNEGSTTVVPLVRDEVSIGRKEGNTIRLTERNVSRRHAELVRANGGYQLKDLDSYNGIRLNGQPTKEASVKPGDEITIGDYSILIQEEAAAALVAPEAAPAEVAALSPMARPASPARIVMLAEPSAGAEFSLPETGQVRIGRSEELDIPINHRSFSREHAEIRCEEGQAFVRDLASANGVTVNGESVQERALRSGDIVELGQVLLRYVEPGEHYFYDPQEAGKYRKAMGGMSQANLRMTAVILACAVVIAVAVLFTGSEEQSASVTELPAAEQAGATAAQVQPAVDPSPAAPEADVDKAVSDCRAALSGGRFAEAVAYATVALRAKPTHAQALECQATAQRQLEEEQTFVRGKSLLDNGDVEGALQEFDRLGPDSAFRKEPAVAQAIARLGDERLAKAVALMESDPTEAVRLAMSVSSVPGMPEGHRTRATQVKADAERALAQAQAKERKAADAAEKEKSRAARAARTGRPRSPKTGADRGNDKSAMDTASACLARGDNACVIRALSGRRGSAQELGLLIETYRAMGKTKQARKNMEQYLKRFPSAPRASAYRRMLERQGN